MSLGENLGEIESQFNNIDVSFAGNLWTFYNSTRNAPMVHVAGGFLVTVVPAEGTCEGCFRFINPFPSVDPGAPQGSSGPSRILELFSRISAVYRTAPGAPQGPLGSPRGFFQWWRPAWLARGENGGRNHLNGCLNPGEHSNLIVEGENFELANKLFEDLIALPSGGNNCTQQSSQIVEILKFVNDELEGVDGRLYDASYSLLVPATRVGSHRHTSIQVCARCLPYNAIYSLCVPTVFVHTKLPLCDVICLLCVSVARVGTSCRPRAQTHANPPLHDASYLLCVSDGCIGTSSNCYKAVQTCTSISVRDVARLLCVLIVDN